MIAVGNDPRDQVEEVDDPRYRVYFWHGVDTDEYESSGADVPDVLEWADHTAAGRTYRPPHAVAVPRPGGA